MISNKRYIRDMKNARYLYEREKERRIFAEIWRDYYKDYLVQIIGEEAQLPE